MHARFTTSLALLALLVVGPAARAEDKQNKIPDDLRAILEKADQFELLSLNPREPDAKPKDGFHGWEVLGKTTVKDADTRKNLVAALQKGVAESDGTVARCFNPRHGIRVTHDGKTTDLVICFECLQVKAFAGDRRHDFLVTRSPQPAFDAVLKEAKVPLPEPAGK
ncbi:MAG TPA: hypothetical protein VKD90_19260 [Gemmataceae bacterium]|nr:hypothetical protein [Gemmataceae bacterium]